MESSSTVVIKVKHGEVLRRFNARVIDEELDLNINGLQEKILSLFSFPPDSELILTYIDEDGDVVTLVDDDDLLDVVKQSLNPLRITVKLNAGKNGKQFNRSSGSSTPLRSPRVQEPLQNLNSGVSEILKTAPEPLRETLMKLSTDLTSKASSSVPVLPELLDLFSKLGLSYLGQVSDSRPEVQPSASPAATETKSPDMPKVDIVQLTVPINGKSVEQSSKSKESSTKLHSEATKDNNLATHENVTGGETLSSKAPVVDAGVNASSSKNINVTKKEKVKKDKLKKISESPNPASSHVQPVANNGTVVGKVGESSSSSSKVIPVVLKKPSLGQKTDGINASGYVQGESQDKSTKTVSHGGLRGSVGSVWAPNFPGPLSVPSVRYECPFSGTPVGNPPAAPPQPASQVTSFPLRRSSSQNDSSGIVFHRGVRCDGCGIHPITGPRFKSKVKVDYDLCSICFSEMGNDSDYMRLDRPAFYRPPMPFKEFYDYAPTLPPVCRGFKHKSGASKLDSRFIQDVNIIDGTIMAPFTPFTKIWRMRNNGTVVWPKKTQLVWIGGDKLSNLLSVEIEVPEAGVPADHELDVAVDFIAPQLPGRYISYWRMASPSGQKFGQRVWVLIQVDAAVKETRSENLRGFNLNLPPVSSCLTGPEIINVDPEPMVDDSQNEPNLSKKTVEVVVPVPDFQPKNEHEMKFPINDSLLVGSGASSSASPAPPTVSYPIIDLSDVGPTFSSVSPTAVATALDSATVELPGNNEVEEKLLRELEEMGFRQVDLNKEILRMHEYDLEQAVDDLCGVAEWDPILEELQEMGFRDTEMNKKLLKKNNGSIKRVVMDLIAGEQ